MAEQNEQAGARCSDSDGDTGETHPNPNYTSGIIAAMQATAHPIPTRLENVTMSTMSAVAAKP